MRGISFLVLTLSLLSCNSAPPPEPVDECPIVLTCDAPGSGGRRPTLVLSGTCPLPDGVIVRIDARRSVDALRGDHIVSENAAAGGGTCEVEKQRFSLELVAERLGRYSFAVQIPWDLQEKVLLEEVKRKVAPGRTWTFPWEVDDEARVIESAKRLSDLAPLVLSALNLITGFENATRSEERWIQEKTGLTERCNALILRPQNSGLNTHFPLALRNLDRMLDYLSVNSERFAFRDGKFIGLPGKPVLPLGLLVVPMDNVDGSPWHGFRVCALETQTLAGREFCLGTIRTLQRSNGVMRPEVSEALTSVKDFPGVAAWATRLAAATLRDLIDLETQVRDFRARSPGK